MNQGGKGIELVKRNISVHKLDADSPTWGGARFLPSTESDKFKVADLAIRGDVQTTAGRRTEIILEAALAHIVAIACA